ncbi:DsbA family protein [Nocardiopsis halophila]|uniref:DsbA family protein n=1 Tax=Nocardiopsis halophila TaxID=141692 RepID=UPI000345CF66|nr:thioredoxin domain-containing protein [Nocardiopsis halophila]
MPPPQPGPGGPPPKKSKTGLVIGLVAGGLVLVLVAAVGGFLLLRGGGQGPSGAGASEGAGPGVSPDGLQVLQDDGSLVHADPGAEAPVVEVYIDFQCPACREFHTERQGLLEEMGESGEAIVHYRPVSVFAKRGGVLAENSVRAGAAAIVAAEYGHYLEYQDLLFERQPVEGEEGFTPEELAGLGEQAGIDDPGFPDRLQEEMDAADAEVNGPGAGSGAAYALIKATDGVMNRYGGADAFAGTPGVYINGESVDPYTADLRARILDADPGEVTTAPR